MRYYFQLLTREKNEIHYEYNLDLIQFRNIKFATLCLPTWTKSICILNLFEDRELKAFIKLNRFLPFLFIKFEFVSTTDDH